MHLSSLKEGLEVLSGGERPTVLRPRPSRHSSMPTMVQQNAAEKHLPGKERGENQVSLPAPHGWQRGSGQEQQKGEAGALQNDPRVGSLLSQASGARLGCGHWFFPCPLANPAGTQRGLGDNPAGTFPEPCRGVHSTCPLSLSLSNGHTASPGRGRCKEQQLPLWTAHAGPDSSPFMETASERLGQADRKAHTAQPHATAACRDQQPQDRHSGGSRAVPGHGAGQQWQRHQRQQRQQWSQRQQRWHQWP